MSLGSAQDPSHFNFFLSCDLIASVRSSTILWVVFLPWSVSASAPIPLPFSRLPFLDLLVVSRLLYPCLYPSTKGEMKERDPRSFFSLLLKVWWAHCWGMEGRTDNNLVP